MTTKYEVIRHEALNVEGDIKAAEAYADNASVRGEYLRLFCELPCQGF